MKGGIVKVLVMTAIAENEEDLQIVMATRTPVGFTMVSPVVTLKGAASSRNGNPYLVYGDAVAEFTCRNKFNVSISVFHNGSGDLQGWF
jgi:hypothetical protein